jgi:hypothetical protein
VELEFGDPYLLARSGVQVESFHPPAGRRATGMGGRDVAARSQPGHDHLNTESGELRGVVPTLGKCVLKPD